MCLPLGVLIVTQMGNADSSCSSGYFVSALLMTSLTRSVTKR